MLVSIMKELFTIVELIAIGDLITAHIDSLVHQLQKSLTCVFPLSLLLNALPIQSHGVERHDLRDRDRFKDEPNSISLRQFANRGVFQQLLKFELAHSLSLLAD
jgi:hypothetical protein